MADTLTYGALRAPGRNAIAAPAALAAAWTTLTSRLRAWRARERLRRSVAHLDDRLLVDAGLDPRDRGYCERLLRRYGAGNGGIWADGARCEAVRMPGQGGWE